MIRIWDNIPGYRADIGDFEPTITPYVLKDGLYHSAVLICPGGGYAGRAYHEGEPIAGWLNSLGINAFVLNYRVAPYRYPYPQMDAAGAIRLIRKNCDEYKIFSDKVGILGFSAGGHLAAFTAVNNKLDVLTVDDDKCKLPYRPDFFILGYPVITMNDYTHNGSRLNLLGNDPDTELLRLCSIELNVNENTPPAFIWHTADDASVHVNNSLYLAAALTKCKIPYELHILQSGRHGLGIKYEVPDVRIWMNLCEKWLIRNNITG